jgi:cytidine deaminase
MVDARLDGLLAAARNVRGHAHAPYSGFAVGAATLDGDRISVGVNIENASFPVGVCAERNALAAMVASGGKILDAVAIVTDAARPTPPCGACRQALWEFGSAEAVVVAETLGGARTVWSLGGLLPSPFERGTT